MSESGVTNANLRRHKRLQPKPYRSHNPKQRSKRMTERKACHCRLDFFHMSEKRNYFVVKRLETMELHYTCFPRIHQENITSSQILFKKKKIIERIMVYCKFACRIIDWIRKYKSELVLRRKVNVKCEIIKRSNN